MKTECALCHHTVSKGLLCKVCYSDWKQSNVIASLQKIEDPEYHGILHDHYEGQKEYVEEFFARVKRSGMTPEEARKQVTKNIDKGRMQ